MIDVLSLMGYGDLVIADQISLPRVIKGCYSSESEWVVLLKDYSMTLIYNVSDNKWSYRTESCQFRDLSNVVFFKRMDSVTVRDMKLNQILSL